MLLDISLIIINVHSILRTFVKLVHLKCSTSWELKEISSNVTQVDNCDVYQEYQDKCYNCETEYYLDESTNTCHEVPETVENCEEFIDADNCKSCVAPYYLENNVCIKSENEIIKCIKYDSNTKCSQCEGASILSTDTTLCL